MTAQMHIAYPQPHPQPCPAHNSTQLDCARLTYVSPASCSQSRVSGGMHFEPAVDDSYTLCDGIGAQAFDGYVQKLLGLTSAANFDDAFPNVVPYPAPMTPTFTIPRA